MSSRSTAAAMRKPFNVTLPTYPINSAQALIVLKRFAYFLSNKPAFTSLHGGSTMPLMRVDHTCKGQRSAQAIFTDDHCDSGMQAQ